MNLTKKHLSMEIVIGSLFQPSLCSETKSTHKKKHQNNWKHVSKAYYKKRRNVVIVWKNLESNTISQDLAH